MLVFWKLSLKPFGKKIIITKLINLQVWNEYFKNKQNLLSIFSSIFLYLV